MARAGFSTMRGGIRLVGVYVCGGRRCHATILRNLAELSGPYGFRINIEQTVSAS